MDDTSDGRILDIPTLGQVAHRASVAGPRPSLWATMAGLAYLVSTAAASVYFLHLVQPTLENDMFWRDFSTLGAQTYLVNAVNREVGYGRRSDHVNFVGPVNWASFEEAYNQPTASVEIKPTAPRRIALADPAMQTIEAAIEALQALDAYYSAFLLSQYCWVDFEKRWELAHTATRAKRCLDLPMYHANAAVYMESMLRNIKWDDFIQTWGSFFNSAVVPFVNSTADGPTWFRRTANAFKDVPTEAAFWRSFGVTHHRVNWSNRYQAAITDTLVIENALGLTQTVTLNRMPVTARGSLYTSIYLYWAILNDMWFAGAQGRSSIVRQAPNFLGNISPTLVDDYYPPTPVRAFVVQGIGPLLSIDAILVAPPASLLELVDQFEHFLVVALTGNEAALDTFQALSTATLDPVPKAWQPSRLGNTATYFGGSPLCIYNLGTPFVQPQFSFDDSCSTEIPSSLQVSPATLAFAVTSVMSSQPSTSIQDACAACNATSISCKTAFDAAVTWTTSFASLLPDVKGLVQAASADVVALDINLVQFVTVGGANVMLRHPVLSGGSGDTHFNLFGWIMLMEWAQGYRECVTFVGDVGSHSILSERVPTTEMRASALEVPAFSCVYLWYIAVFTSAVIVLLVVVALVYVGIERLHHTLQWRHLFAFNRVAGPVWIGRPMLLIRALVALIVLSSAPIAFVSSVDGGSSRFELRPRHWIESWVVSGEATWLTYVASDILLVVAGPATSKWSAPLSSALVWIVTFAIDVASPVTLRSSIGRTCTRVNVDQEVTCVSGVVAIGDVWRFSAILWVNAACLATCYVGVAAFQLCRNKAATTTSTVGVDEGSKPDRTNSIVPYSIYASGATFLSRPTTSKWSVSSPVAIMCGLVPFTCRGRGYIFDTQLWVVFNAIDTAQSEEDLFLYKSFQVLRGVTSTTFGNDQGRAPSKAAAATTTRVGVGPRHQQLLVLGVIYVVASLVGSYSYLIVAKGRLSNDFWWEHFNSSGTHTFLANWFNEQLFYKTDRSHLDGIQLDDPKFGVWGTFGSGKEVVSSSILYPRLVMGIEAGEALAVAIDGLRRTDSCLLPWIATQYCWLDFERSWEMANSAARQRRCAQSDDMKTNGAVYVESLLRNTDWVAFSSCWGAAFNMSIGQDVATTPKGVAWLLSVQTSNPNSIPDEVALWDRHKIDRFKLQWQNYKSLGLVDKFTVENAFGLTFPMSLKASNGTFRLSSQTSLKMYWSWASDLDAVAAQSSPMANSSLLRSSPRFAFANASMEHALLANSSFLQAPLSQGYQIFQATIGPFGSVDLYHVAIPSSMALLNKLVVEMTFAALAVPSNNTSDATYPAQSALAQVQALTQFASVPPEWNSTLYRSQGGNILCNDFPGIGIDMGVVLAAFTGLDVMCNSGMGDRIYSSKPQQVFALISAGIVADYILKSNTEPREEALATSLVRPYCMVEKLSPGLCTTSYAGVLRWIAANVPLRTIQSVDALARVALEDLQRLNIEVMQYGRHVVTNAVTMLRRPIFKDVANDPYALAAWGFMSEWVQGSREVISIQGDIGSITVVSAKSSPATSTMNAMEVPTNVALYVRTICMYITGVLIAVTSLALVLTVRCRFRVEGSNFFKLNRVAGIAWIGRPLLLLRGMSALCLLSTGSLQLVARGAISTIVSTTPPWYTVILASGEVGWIVYITNDLTMPYTKHLTPRFATMVGAVTWAVAAGISVASPVSPSATLSRQCSVVQTDMQLVCVSGTVYIGDLTRFATLIGVAVGLSIAGVCITLLKHGRTTSPNLIVGKPSHLLSAGANFLFQRKDWVHNDTCYIDLASAAAAGLLVVQYKTHHYVLDIKTWRTLVLPAHHDGVESHPNGPALRYALPLIK